MKLGHSIYCLGLTIAHLLYTLVFPSIINGERFLGSSYKLLEPSYIHAFFLSRIKFGEFARRPITTWLIQFLEGFGTPLEYAFIITEYSGLFISVLLLFRLAHGFFKSTKYAVASTAIYISSFWVLHSFFAEIYAYDEPWQYVALFTALNYLRRQKWLIFSIFLFIALIARESTLLLLPGLFVFFVVGESKIWTKETLLKTLKVLWVLPAYALFLVLFITSKDLVSKSSSYMEDVRFKHLYFSFADADIGIDTITSFILSLSVAATLLILRKRTKRLGFDKPWIWAFILNFGINAFITFTLTMGRETRIFAQPIVTLFPFLGYYLLEGINSLGLPFSNVFQSRQTFFKWGSTLLFFSALVFALSLFTYELYWPTDTKFFSGFQHWAYLTVSMCTLLILFTGFPGHNAKNTFKSYLPSLAFIIPITVFFGNQHGYRAYDTYGPIGEHIKTYEEKVNRPQYLIVSSNMPNLAENFFKSSSQSCLAGDFNFQLPVKQFLYRTSEFENHDLVYVELQPAINFPFRYIMSDFGGVSSEIINGREITHISTNASPLIETNTFHCLDESVGFIPKTGTANGEPFYLKDEYSIAFKTTLSDLNIDSLHSIAARTDFICDMNSEAAIVVTVKSPGLNEVWEHEFLSIFLIDENGWNTAYMAKGGLTFTNPETEISFYIWNPKKDEVQLRNLEVVLNTRWVSKKAQRTDVLSSRNLE